MADFKALYLEDDKDMHLLISKNLPENLDFRVACTIEEAKAFLEKETFHLILVDINLNANESGFDFINYLTNKEFPFIPSILIISSSVSEDDEIRSHEANVLEFVRKPIRPKVLKAQLEKYLRRFSMVRSLRRLGPLQIDELKMEVKMIFQDAKDEVICLTLKEYKLLLKLIDNPARTYSREELLTEVWNANSAVQSRTIDMHISSLRKKLGAFGDAISSRRGVGYTFDLQKVVN